MTGGPIGVLIVDDSAVVRQILTARLRASPGIEVLGAVADPIFAMEAMNRHWPDVVVLDIEMPRMDGLTFLRKIMAVRPTPVVICSTLTARGAEVALEALNAGAVTVFTKPTSGLKAFVEEASADIVAAVRTAAATRRERRPAPVMTRTAGGAAQVGYRQPAPAAPVIPKPAAGPERSLDRVVAIGTSTGGTRALEAVLPALDRATPGVVIVQHMPEKFTAAFAARLDTMCRMRVSEAVDGDAVLPGRVLIAPGGRHMEIFRDATAGYRVKIIDGPPVNRHRPSVDVLFRSVARAAGASALGIIMTGMGDDGARGLLEMHKAGAYTVAQDEATCVVHGMPHEAVLLGGVDREAPLSSIAEVIHRHG